MLMYILTLTSLYFLGFGNIKNAHVCVASACDSENLLNSFVYITHRILAMQVSIH